MWQAVWGARVQPWPGRRCCMLREQNQSCGQIMRRVIRSMCNGRHGLHILRRCASSRCVLLRRWLTGEEYVGNEIELIQNVSSKGDCCSACASSTKCKYFTYDSTKSTCSLKSENAPDTSRINPACSSGFVGGDPPAPDPPAVVSVSVAGPVISRTEPSFVCWNLDASRNRQFFDRNLSQSTALGAQMSRQAAAISAVQEDGYSLLRFGGTGNGT